MTFHYVVPGANGRYLQAGSCVSAEGAPEGAVEVEQAVDTRRKYHDEATGKPVSIPAAPSRHHKFDYPTKQWVDRRTAATEWVVVRAERDKRLTATDFTQLPDSPKDRQKWAAYRQALRDITKQADPFNVTWPQEPV